MPRFPLTLIALFFAGHAFSQPAKTEQDFEADFTQALDSNFTDRQLHKMFSEYSELLTPHSDVTRLATELKGHVVLRYPLYRFRQQNLYLTHIDSLLESPNPNHRLLAYLVIAASFDTARVPVLLGKIQTEKEKGDLFWAGMALLYLQSNHTTSLFDFLVNNEDFGDAHLFPMFIKLDKDSLQQTAYSRIQFKDDKSRILAAQTLAYTPLNAKTEDLLKEAVRTWDTSIKGYAIFSLKELQAGDLLETIKPLLALQATRSISLEALANSPTEADRHYLVDLVNQQDTVSRDLLNCFYKSKRIENVEYWLRLLYTKPIPVNYRFFTFEQTLLGSDSVLPNLQEALLRISNKKVLCEMVKALTGRTDDRSIDIMISLLNHTGSSVRYWTARTLQDNPAEKVKTPEVKALIAKGLEDGNHPDDQ
jgi:hypothetical protein